VEARPAIVAHQGPPLAQSIVGPLHADFVQAHNEASWRGLEILTGSGRLLQWSPATTDTRVLRLWSKPNRLLSRLGAQAV
jgi:hypothetical protein